MKALSLFSGIGGLDLAAHWAGIETVALCEREPFPQKVLRKHWPDIPIYDDVCELTKERLEADGIGTIELIHGGYPCQPFSNAGKRQGENDDRHLWPEVRRLIETIRPRWFVGENVAGHVTLGLDDVLSDLEAIGYTAKPFVLPASAVGAPHRRDRVFIVAYSDSIGDNKPNERGVDGDWSEKVQGWQESFSGFGNNSNDVGDSKRVGCSGEPWRGTESQLEDGYIGMEIQNVANAESGGRRSRGTEQQGQQGELCIVGGRTSFHVADDSS
jgi:DNA-cytosine methyltransferase